MISPAKLILIFKMILKQNFNCSSYNLGRKFTIIYDSRFNQMEVFLTKYNNSPYFTITPINFLPGYAGIFKLR